MDSHIKGIQVKTNKIKHAAFGSVSTERVFGKPTVNHDSNTPKTGSLETKSLNCKGMSIHLL